MGYAFGCCAVAVETKRGYVCRRYSAVSCPLGNYCSWNLKPIYVDIDTIPSRSACRLAACFIISVRFFRV